MESVWEHLGGVLSTCFDPRYDNLLRKKAAQLYKDSCDSQPGRRGPARQTVKDGVDWEEVVSGETRVVDAPGLLQGGAAYVPAAAAGPWFQIPPAGITVLGGGSGTITDQNGTNILLTVNDVAARVNKAAVKGFPTPMQIAATGWDDDNGGAADKLRQLPATLASLRDIWQRIRNYGAAQGWAAYNGPAVHGGQIQSHIDAILAVSQG